MDKKTISVIGLGYIGLPTAVMFAQAKMKVIGVDTVSSIVDTINEGKVHVVEPGLEELVKTAVTQGYLRASLHIEPADAFFITVPTPLKEGFKPDLSYVEIAINSISAVLKKGDIVILESTSPVGTTEQLVNQLQVLRPDLKFPSETNQNPDVYVAYCPERVLPGNILYELVNNDRVIGGITPVCAKLAEKLYKVFVKGRMLHTSVRTAEMVKLAENSFRDVNIAFANELSMICDSIGVNVWELIELANHHPRVNVLRPGAGVGGHCVAIDPWFIIDKAPEFTKLIRVAREVNEDKSQWVINKVNHAVLEYLQKTPEKPLKDLKIACFGLSYKPNVQDMRESPALKIFRELCQIYKGQVVGVDLDIELKDNPNCLNTGAFPILPLEDAILFADIYVILVGHSKFISCIKENQYNKVVLDFIGFINTEEGYN